MKKKIALFMIVNMLMAIFTVINLKDVSAEQETCCVLSDSCGLMSAAACASAKGQNSYAVNCNYVPQCATGCCVSASSCESGRTKTWCNLNGGSWNSGDCSANSECAIGSCIINGQCYSGWNKRQCDARGTGAKFDASLQDSASCQASISTTEGCCISGNSCARQDQQSCTSSGGRFVSGYLCSLNSITNCNQCLPRDHKTCKNGKVYWVDSCGNTENIADDKNEHTAYDQASGRILADSALKNNKGNCKIEEGMICGKDSKGNVGCLDSNCNADESFYVETNFEPEVAMFLDQESVKIEQNFLGETYEQQKGNRDLIYTQSAPSKENTQIRKNGESWCMIWPQSGYNSVRKEADRANPGSRDYVFKCDYGKIEVEPCADYRSGICSESYNSDEDTTSAKCGDNNWRGCIGASQKKCDDKNLDCRWVNGECVPLIPPGNVFWSEDVSQGNSIMCEKCGHGWLSNCDDSSCVRLGDCKSSTIGFWSRAWRATLVGAVVATAVVCAFTGGWCVTWIPGVGGTTAPALPPGVVTSGFAPGELAAQSATGFTFGKAMADVSLIGGLAATGKNLIEGSPGSPEAENYANPAAPTSDVPRSSENTKQTTSLPTNSGTQNQQCSGYVFSNCVNNRATILKKEKQSDGGCTYTPQEGCDCNSNSDYNYIFAPTSCTEMLKKYNK